MTSYASLNRVQSSGFDFVICDEAHYLKNPQAKRTKTLESLLSGALPEYLVLLTGTPIKNRVGEFYSLLRFLSACPHGTNGNKMHMTYWDFQRHFMHFEQFKVKGRMITRFHGHRNVPELKQLLRNKYLRRKCDQLDLPPITRKNVNFDLDKTQQEKDLKDAWKEYNGGKKSKHIMSVKAVNALSKVPHTAKYVQDILDQDQQVVVFSDHVKVVSELSKKFSNSVGITGEVAADKRADYVRKFQSGKIRVIFATIGALSTGVTLTASSNLVFNDYPWVPADLLQAEKRIHRIGQEKPCLIHMLFSGNMDKMIYHTILKKLKTIGEVV